MYITVMSSSPQLLNTVIEEKMSRISEVLIASVTPFQLMMGKLLGSVGVSVLLSLIYFAGGIAVAYYWGYAGAITVPMVLWFVVFLVLAVLMFGSIFIAIGAACTDLKDSQNMAGPAMILVVLPLLTWMTVLRAPDGPAALALSLFPTATPFLMLLRISLPPGPPAWQIALAILLTLATVVLFVWAAGKIFRAGLLMQGKSATVPEMLRWIRA
jgi:ABC-type Na+ efflux pump permease subunit